MTVQIYWRVIMSLFFAIMFAVVDLYLVNLSSYVAGGLLAWLVLEGRTNDEVQMRRDLTQEKQKARRGGRLPL